MKAFIAFLLVLIVAGLGYLIWNAEAEKRMRVQSVTSQTVVARPVQSSASPPVNPEEELFGTYVSSIEGTNISAALVLNRDHSGSMLSRIDGKVTLAQNGRWDADLAYVRLSDGHSPVRFKRVGNDLEMIGVAGQSESDGILFKKVPAMLVAH